MDELAEISSGMVDLSNWPAVIVSKQVKRRGKGKVTVSGILSFYPEDPDRWVTIGDDDETADDSPTYALDVVFYSNSGWCGQVGELALLPEGTFLLATGEMHSLYQPVRIEGEEYHGTFYLDAFSVGVDSGYQAPDLSAVLCTANPTNFQLLAANAKANFCTACGVPTSKLVSGPNTRCFCPNCTP